MNAHDLVTGIVPMEHQVAQAKYMVENAYGCANTSEQGTGKTLSTIIAINALAKRQSAKRVLVVCPLSLRWNWHDEIMNYSAIAWQVSVLDGSTTKRKEQLSNVQQVSKTMPHLNQVVIVNYDALPRMSKELAAYKPDVVVIDEAHAIKNPRSQRAKHLRVVPAVYKYALTGTPVVCNPLDVWSMYDWLVPGMLFKNYYVFRARYCVIYSGGGFPMIKSFRHLDELKKRTDKCTCRITKRECLDLPEKRFVTHHVDLTAKEAQAYSDMSTQLVAEIEGLGTVSVNTLLTKMLRLQQITGGFINDAEGKTHRVTELPAKLSALEELLEGLIDHKVVVWARFTAEIQAIKALCEKAKRKCYVMAGETSEQDRHQHVKDFQNIDDNAVFIGNVAVGGVGITLTKASHCVYFSNTWSLGDRLQSQDRLHRIGQTNKVTYYDMVARGTIDEYVLKVVSKKASMSDKITGDDVKKMLKGY